MTKSLKITLNGKEEIIAGAENAIKITCETEYFPEHNKCNHRVYAMVKPKSGRRMYAEWCNHSGMELSQITLQVIDAENPDPIVRDRPEFSDWNPEGRLVNVCSFCGKHQVK